MYHRYSKISSKKPLFLHTPGVEVNRVSTQFRTGSQLLIGEPDHVVNFDVTAWANSAGASITGQQLWRMVLFTNTQIDGKGQTGAESQVIFVGGGANTPLSAGQNMRINNVEAHLNLQQLTCEQVCIHLLHYPPPPITGCIKQWCVQMLWMSDIAV